MRIKFVTLLCFLIFCSVAVFGQSSRSNTTPDTKQAPTSLNPNNSQATFAPRQTKKVRGKQSRMSPEAEFAQRMEAVARARRKQEAEMRKPQYSDPMYFGHKKMPKKHSPKKMRFCKECGIRH